MSNLPFYSFLPWARRGLSNQIGEADTLGASSGSATERAKIQPFVHITADGAAQTPIGVNLDIISPGDIVGISQSAVVRTEPANWITNFEPHSFPFIEFYEEDFPWRYTPASPASPTGIPNSNPSLRPWLTLVVLKEDEFDRKTVDGAPLTAFQINSNISAANFPFPKHTELWAWAHVSIQDKLTGADVNAKMGNLNAKLAANPDVAVSRIICPRKLEENTSYYAFLIPTFETGRLAGLGKNPASFTPALKAQAPAWDHINPTSAPSPDIHFGTFPIYYEWYFRTGATGDFEYLVRQVKPRVLDTRVGKRPMDVQDPGYGLNYNLGSGDMAGALMLEGALRIPNNNPAVFTEPYTAPSLKEFINLGEDMLSTTANSWKTTLSTGNDPVITPPLYGRWHALRNKIDTQTNPNLWLNELNLDPRNRVAASLGADYVRKNQERLMDLAWDQVGHVIEGNRRARQAQLAMETSVAMNNKHLAPLPIEQLVAITSNVHGKVKTSGNVSVLQDVLNSQLPEGAGTNAFRKLRRPTGVLMKRIDPNTQNHFNQTLVNLSQNAASSPAAGKTTPNATLFQNTNMNTAVNAVLQYSNASSVSFNISSPSGPTPPANATVASNFQVVMNSYSNLYTTTNWAAPAAPPDVLAPVQFTTDLKDGIAPEKTHSRGFIASVGNNTLFTPLIADTIVPAMTAPSFFIPMYKSLQELGLDYFIPNLNLIPQNSITLLQTNQKFIESFLVGANYEMGRELLWREYPTDQRGTYFHHFWDSKDSVKPSGMSDANFEISVRDIDDIHKWPSNTQLGTHTGRTATANQLVLAIRGDFLKKFPTAVIYAIKAKWQMNGTNIDTTKHRIEDPNATPLYPLFSAKVEPDITFLGFDLKESDAKGVKYDLNNPGYYFVIMERPGELRFGLDFPDSGATSPMPAPANWNGLTWGHVTVNPTTKYMHVTPAPLTPTTTAKLPPSDTTAADTNWGTDAAAMAMIMYQNPVMVMIHAHEMLL